MLTGDDIQELQLNAGFTVENSILQKIQMLTKNENLYDFTKNEKTKIKTEVNLKIKKLEENRHEKVLYWKINDSICVIPESTASKTSSIERRNNIEEVNEFLDNKYANDYLVISFRKTRIASLLKRCLIFDDNEGFNLVNSYKIAQICNFWINSGENRVVVIEMKSKSEYEQLFTLSCVLSYCKFYLSAELAFNALLMSSQSIWRFRNIETISRYAKYYDSAISQTHNSKFAQINLNQMIITTIPSILKCGDFTPKLKISTGGRIYEFSLDNCYKDKDYIIFSNLNVEMGGDSKISLAFEQGKKLFHVFDLCINSLLYHQGLYRFLRSDVMTLLPHDSIYQFFQEGFCIDLVFLESQDESIKNPFALPLSMLDLINLMLDKFSGDSRLESGNDLYKRLLDKSFNPSLAKFCCEMQLLEHESLILHSKLEESGYRSGLLRQTFELAIVDESLKEQILIERSPDHNFESDKFNLCDDQFEIGEIELIEDLPITKDFAKKSSSSLFNRQKAPISVFEIKENVFAKKPLHLTAMKSIENTIFADIKDIRISIDYNIIEKVFCESAAKSNAVKYKIETISKHRIDARRVFIVSILFKQLEMKRILLDELEEILEIMPDKIGYQELLGIYKALPTEEELILLEAAEIAELSEIESQMLNLSKIPEIRKILNILIFERSCIEDAISIEKLLDSTSSLVSMILTDKTIKFIFKGILEISNVLNYTYGKRKKLIEGFKLESLYFLIAYEENKEVSLVDFLVETLIRNEASFAHIFPKLKDIDKLKSEDYSGLKDKINGIILKYREICTDLKSLEHFDRLKHDKMIFFTYKKLLEVSGKYKEFEKKSIDLRMKLGEEDKKPINFIFKSLSDFFQCLEISERKVSKALKGK